ncbi:hypothetical protein AB6735_22345 [Mucilaginibacter sp. RCC_168]|uniref:hypothetical protein n=1 Tax=Mucilaginibacter sp. RCC_168 TaxID=3239221 RepID=UPI00352625AD
MTGTKFTALLLGSYISFYVAKIIYGYPRKKRDLDNDQKAPADAPATLDHIPLNTAIEPSIIPARSTLKSLFAYDTSDHHTLMHVRFDQQTVDTLNKFKLATGVDMSKFVAFAVRHLLNTNPEFKSIINKYLQRTQL